MTLDEAREIAAKGGRLKGEFGHLNELTLYLEAKSFLSGYEQAVRDAAAAVVSTNDSGDWCECAQTRLSILALSK